MKVVKSVLGVLPAFGLAVSAGASVTSIGEFTGDLFEGFENFSAPAPWPGPMPIFNGAATFDDQVTDPWIVNSLTGGDLTLFAYDGNFMGLAPTGWTRWTFDAPMHRFGGFFGSTLPGVGGAARFLDGDGAVIESVAFSTVAGQYSWHGWEVEGGFVTVEILAGANPGTTMVYDNMQASYLPAPGALALLMLGAGAMRRRRR